MQIYTWSVYKVTESWRHIKSTSADKTYIFFVCIRQEKNTKKKLAKRSGKFALQTRRMEQLTYIVVLVEFFHDAALKQKHIQCMSRSGQCESCFLSSLYLFFFVCNGAAKLHRVNTFLFFRFVPNCYLCSRNMWYATGDEADVCGGPGRIIACQLLLRAGIRGRATCLRGMRLFSMHGHKCYAIFRATMDTWTGSNAAVALWSGGMVHAIENAVYMNGISVALATTPLWFIRQRYEFLSFTRIMHHTHAIVSVIQR